MTLKEFLSNFDFEYKIENGLIALVDTQGANLGNIENDRFTTVEEVIERLDTYINDDQLEGIDYELKERGIDENTLSDMSLEEKVKMADDIGATVYDYYRAILNPSLIKMEEKKMDFNFTVKRERHSTTQGEAVVYLNGVEMIRFGDTIELVDGEWKSIKKDSDFIRGLLFHPYDNIYKYSDKVKKYLDEN